MKDGDLTRREFVRTSAAAAAVVAVGGAARGEDIDPNKIPSYNAEMEYRRLGKTGMMVSAVCLGGHWKNIQKAVPGVLKGRGWLSAKVDHEGFKANRRDVIDCCMAHGINYVDACTREEVVAYAEALRGREDRMYFGYSWYQEEMRNGKFRTAEALLRTLEKGMKASKREYVDLWRIVMIDKSSRHSEKEIDEMFKALTTAKKQGKVRHIGLSSHDRPHIKKLIEQYDELEAVVMPYTATTKKLPTDSIFEALKKHDVGFLGIKPFSSNRLFKGDGTPTGDNAEADNRKARLALRNILHNPQVTAPIPGMIFPEHVVNAAQAVRERRELDKAETAELEEAMKQAWAALPPSYEWLKDWQYI
ncbi:MAG: aldo/keto reductase [Planctomycetota bacterium]|jgi:aryl-alcohol dehydrogenase-like predicted oxidoreductase